MVVWGALHPHQGRTRKPCIDMVDWPVVDDALLNVLVHYFKTPFRLQAAFEDEASCTELIQSIFPDLISEDVANFAAGLVLWRDSNQVAFKRQRRAVVSEALFKLPSPLSCSVQDSFNAVTRMNPAVLLEAFAKRKQKQHKEEPADVRARRYFPINPVTESSIAIPSTK